MIFGWGKNKKTEEEPSRVKASEFSTDAFDVMGNANDVDMDQVRAEFIQQNAIQRRAPEPNAQEGAAMDSSCSGSAAQYSPNYEKANPYILSYFVASSSFIDYYACALIAQHWLVAKGCSMKVDDAVKKWFEIAVCDGTKLESEQTKFIEGQDRKYKLKQNMVEAISFNNVFGIRHILFKHKDPDFDYEKPFNPDSFKDGNYAGISQVDPYWVTPVFDNNDLIDPSAIGFYEPTYWLIQGKKYHKSHFVILRGDEVADYLKPTYKYGGIPLVQKVYERVYAAERTANEAPQLTMTKRMTVLGADLAKAQANKAGFVERIKEWVNYRDNYGIKIKGKEETIEQFDTSLTDLEQTIMTQYQLVCSEFGIPATKLLGVSPKGFSTGETDNDMYLEDVEALQGAELEEIALAHYARLIPSAITPKLGVQDIEIEISWRPLKIMSAKEKADVNFINAQADAQLYDRGAIDNYDIRERLIKNPDSGYSGLSMPEQDDSDAMDAYGLDFVREDGGKFYVFSEKGKRLSKGYSSKKEADQRLEQIEYWKSLDVFLTEASVDAYEAQYEGREVTLNKPFRTPGESKKFAVYVENDKGNVIKVRFGDGDMEIRRDDPKARESFRARHDCENKDDPTKPGYWSCKFWSSKSVGELMGD